MCCCADAVLSAAVLLLLLVLLAQVHRGYCCRCCCHWPPLLLFLLLCVAIDGSRYRCYGAALQRATCFAKDGDLRVFATASRARSPVGSVDPPRADLRGLVFRERRALPDVSI